MNHGVWNAGYWHLWDGGQETLDSVAQKLYPQGMEKNTQERARILAFWRTHGLQAAQDAFGYDRATFYRWAAKEKEGALAPASTAPKRRRTRRVPELIKQEIVRLRTLYPRLGKQKLAVLLQQFCQGQQLPQLSESTIGQLFTDLKAAGLLPSNKKLRLLARSGKLAERTLTKEPKLRRSGYIPKLPGDLVQLDTVVTHTGGTSRYTVTAIDLASRFAFAWTYPNDGSRSAADFLTTFRRIAPFQMTRIQTDNGSEFAKEFREAALAASLTHFFTYPKRPQTNGTIERFNRTLQEEFLVWRKDMLAYDLERFNAETLEWLIWYNGLRPHQGLRLAAPLAYLSENCGLSQMSWTSTIPAKHHACHTGCRQ